MIDRETLCIMALTCVHGLSRKQALSLYLKVGSAEKLFSEYKNVIPEITSLIVQRLDMGKAEAFRRAEREATFDDAHGIVVLTYNAMAYPYRLRECPDAPLVLYYKGNVDLNSPQILSMVGTRRCTEYGKDMCTRFTQHFASKCPELLVVSGLAYGIDIHSHRGALKEGLNTVAVLAHGLDRIYPYVHRDTASKMIEQGGLLTEYMTGTNPDKGNFIQRNRIVAGMSDGCIVVESPLKGGAIITARLTQDYNREVMAVPGRVDDECSEGCNALIRSSIAALVTNVDDVLSVMGWMNTEEQKKKREQPVQSDLFPCLSEEERIIVNLLKDSEGKQINQLVVESDMPVQRISAILFELEIHGVVKLLAGGRYRLLI